MTNHRRLVRSISEMVSLALDALEGLPVEVISDQRISYCYYDWTMYRNLSINVTLPFGCANVLT